jgi:hypothetical protein
VPKPSGYSKTREEMFQVLEVSPEDLDSVPQISHILKKAKIYGDLNDYLRGSQDPLAKTYLKKFDSLAAKYQRVAPVEAVCIAAGIDTEKFFAVVAAAVFRQTKHTAELLAASAQPKVVEASVERATSPDGVADRKMLFQHAEFLPMPKTQIIANKGNVTLDHSDNRVQVAILPSTEGDVRRMSDRFNQRFIGGESPKPPEDEGVIEGEFEDEEESD